MNDPRDATTSEPRSTLYVVVSAVLAAAILGLTLFLLVRGFQWRAALADLRAEPGIEVLSVERAGFFRKRILGLRDPLAPLAEDIIARHNISAHTYNLSLTEYHSLDTPYACQREEAVESRIEGVRDSLVDAVAKFAEEMEAKRDEDLERITTMLFETQFPEEMKSVGLSREDETWFAEGKLYDPVHERFREKSPQYLLEGTLDFSRLENLTKTRTRSLRSQVEKTNLLQVDIDGNYTHVDQVVRLVSDYDEVCDISELPLPRFRLKVISPSEVGDEDQRIASLWSELTVDDGLAPGRFEETVMLLPAEEGGLAPGGAEELVAFLEILPVEE